MNIIAATLYDPATAASKATDVLLAMTALDTTNLRLQSVLTPPSGRLRVRMQCTLDVGLGAGVPQILLGVMSGSTVLARVTPKVTAAEAFRAHVEADFVVTGLAGVSFYDLDAAYAVQLVEAGSSIAYGGPDNSAGDNAFGGFLFEIWSDAADEAETVAPDRTNDASSH